MEKTTRENVENDYKEAIRAKYRKEKEGGDYYDFLAIPGQASLRDLCWKIFRSNPKKDDLKTYSDFFKFDFDSKEENTSTTYTDKFRKVGTFYKEGKKPAKNSTIELAAILVDFEPRPFNKFRIHNLYPDDISDDNLVLENQPKKQIEGSGDLENFLDEKEREKGIEKGIVEEKEDIEVREKEEVKEREEIKQSSIEEIESRPQAINAFVSIQKNPRIKLGPRIRKAVIGLALVLCIGFPVIFFAFPAKGCMQWTGNKYEMVDCDLKAADNNIELLDPTLINLKKVQVCDTTTCFDKNGVAIIWYAKTANGIDFFNAHGRHPENNSSLRPVTNYILKKYVRNKISN